MFYLKYKEQRQQAIFHSNQEHETNLSTSIKFKILYEKILNELTL